MFDIVDKKTTATVTIPLVELDALRNKIQRLEANVARLQAQKEITVTIDTDIYDYRSNNRETGNRTRTYSNWNEFVDNWDKWKETQEAFEEVFQKIIDKSIEKRFYKKFPTWIHDIFGCGKFSTNETR